MIKKSVKTVIDTKEASLTPKEASLQSSNVIAPKSTYCETCKVWVDPLEKMGGFICPVCRHIVRYKNE